MKRSTLLSASLSLAAVACDKPAEPAADKTTAEKAPEKKDLHDAFPNLSPDEMQKLIEAKAGVPVDANGAETRSKYGIVPGAVLLSGADFKTAELPEDKSSKLVFYCGGKMCTAAPKAAKLAKEAGYDDVSVMRAGIRGYVDAGKKVDKPKS